MKGKRASLLAGCVAGSILVAGGLAWACTQQAQLSIITRSIDKGSSVAVTGFGFAPGVPVEIRLNAIDGPLVGTAQGPDFQTAMSIPADITPGAHYVVALQPASAAHPANKAMAAIEVGGPGRNGSTFGGDAWTGFSSQKTSGLEGAGRGTRSRPGSEAAALAVTAGIVGLGTALAGAAVRSRRRVKA